METYWPHWPHKLSNSWSIIAVIGKEGSNDTSWPLQESSLLFGRILGCHMVSLFGVSKETGPSCSMMHKLFKTIEDAVAHVLSRMQRVSMSIFK